MIDQSLLNIINKNKHGIVIMTELATDRYFEESALCLRRLIENGMQGIYISFQRPFSNLIPYFHARNVDINNLLFIDVATAIAGDAQSTHERVIHINRSIDINELVRAIYTSLPRLKSKNKFVFIDSISTITLHKPLSETLRFSEFLIRTTQKSEPDEEVFLIFNVAKGLAQKKFIKDIALRVHEVIRD